MRPLLPLVVLALLLGACRQPEPEPEPSDGQLRVETERYVESNPELQYAVNLAFPRLVPDDDELIARVNNAIEDTVRALVDAIRPGRGDLPPGPDAGQMDVGEMEGGFDHVLLTPDVFSTLLVVEAFTGGAHGMTFARSLTYDLRTSAPITLAELFRAGAPYLEVLAERATDHLRQQGHLLEEDPADESGANGQATEEAPATDYGTFRQMPEEEAFAGHVPATAEAIWAFALREDGLLLFFPPYSIAPYSFGSAHVVIPYHEIEEILDPMGPVGRIRGTTVPEPLAER